MAPTKGAKGSKPPAKSPKSSSSSNRVSKSKSKGAKSTAAKEHKAKPRSAPELLKKKKKRVYTEKELNLPDLNMITPVGVQKPRGKKKGKIFVDDQESMMTILAMVNAEKEGQIESRMIKARHMEEIREARRAELDARKEQKKSKLEETKDSIRKSRKRKGHKDDGNKLDQKESLDEPSSPKPGKKGKSKRVSFA
ncbi:60S ribosomal subunit assembly/export protein [Myotisia sp. PD_48]|nr:60S ribosomal subunit assembly/export protein [Myotisia sp. PD_48]